MAKQGKRIKASSEGRDREAFYSVEDAVKFVKDNAKVKFDETIEIAMNLGVDPRHSEQQVRGMVQLPHGTGKAMRVAVFAKDAKAEDAKNAGADVVGGEDLAEKVQAGEINFDRLGSILKEGCPSASFIPEIWQGHKNGGEGFWIAMEKLEGKI